MTPPASGDPAPRDAAVLAVEAVQGRARATSLDAGAQLRPRLIDVHGTRARVALVATCASLLAGDRMHLDVRVGAGAALELYEPSATVAYNARGARAAWRATVRVEAGGVLVWRSAPFVVADGADARRDVEVVLAPDARALLADTIVLGRGGEDGGDLVSSTRVVAEGRELLVEEVDLRSGGYREHAGVLGGARVLASAMLLGRRPAEVRPPHETLLHGPGALARWLACEAHAAERELDATWNRWAAELGHAPATAASPGAAANVPVG